jgi:hypothetical protein
MLRNNFSTRIADCQLVCSDNDRGEELSALYAKKETVGPCVAPVAQDNSATVGHRNRVGDFSASTGIHNKHDFALSFREETCQR